MRFSRLAALALAAAVATGSDAAAASREVLPWIEVYSVAVEQARARNVPIFVEAWAPW